MDWPEGEFADLIADFEDWDTFSHIPEFECLEL